jgi:hypothetical protein
MFISPDIPRVVVAECCGQAHDFKLLEEDRWLLNTEVRYLLLRKHRLWHLFMVYIAIDNPLQLLCKQIDVYASQHKAETFAKILQRGIRRDARGTLKMNRNAFHICTN